MHEGRLADYREVARRSTGNDPNVDAVVQFGIAYEEAFLDWLASLPFAP